MPKTLTKEEFKLRYNFEYPSRMKGEMIKFVEGKPGKPGTDFNFETERGKITQIIKEYIFSLKDELKLKLSDLSEEEMNMITGPKGKDGQDFILADALGYINKEIDKYLKSKLEYLKLKFSDLTQEERDSLKLKFSDLTEEEKDELAKRGRRKGIGFGGAFPAYEREISFTGTQDGSNKTFTMVVAPHSGSFKLFYNGLLLEENGDYTITNTYTVTFVAAFEAPVASDKIKMFGVY